VVVVAEILRAGALRIDEPDQRKEPGLKAMVVGVGGAVLMAVFLAGQISGRDSVQILRC